MKEKEKGWSIINGRKENTRGPKGHTDPYKNPHSLGDIILILGY